MIQSPFDPKRREFIKCGCTTLALASVGIHLNPFRAFAGDPEKDLVWDKAPCRFCGTGCGVQVGVKDGTILAVKGDPQSSVNQGTLCIKGYSLPFIQYGQDRLKQPLIRKKNGAFDKDGVLTPATWDEALDLMATKAKAAIQKKGPAAGGAGGAGLGDPSAALAVCGRVAVLVAVEGP